MKNTLKTKFGKLLFLSVFLSLALSSQSFADTWNWDDSNIGCDGSWNDTNCWDSSDGTDVLPQSDDDVYFQSGSGDCTIDTGFTINSLELVSPYGDTITVTTSSNLNILGAFTIGTGVINGGAGTIDVGGNFTQNGATVNLYGDFVVDGGVDWNGGVFDMNGNAATLNNGGSGFHTWADSAFITLDGSTDFNNDLYLTSGTIDTGISAVTVGRNLNVDGGTLTMSSGGSWDIAAFFDVDGGTVNLGGDIYIDNYLDIASGATVNEGTGTLIFDDAASSATPYITDARSSGAYEFYRIEVDLTGSGSTFEVNGNTTVSSALILTNGALTGTNTITTNGQFFCYSGFDGGSGTEVIIGGTATTGGVIQNGAQVPKFTLNNPNITIERIGESSNNTAATFTGLVNIEQGNLDLFIADKDTQTQTGYIFVPTIFNAQVNVYGGTVDMNHTQGVDPIGGAVTFNSRFVNAGGTLITGTYDTTFNDDVYLYEGTFTASAGNIYINADTVVNTSGSYTNDATFNMESATSVDFNGSLTLGKIGSPSATTTLSTTATTLSGNLSIYGGTNLSATAGYLEFDGSTDSVVTLFDGAGSEDFYRVDINKGTATNYVSVASGDIMNLSSTLVLENGLIEGSGKISSNFRTTWNETFDGGTGTIVLKHSGTNNLTIPDGIPVPNLELDNSNHSSTLTVSTSGTHAQTIQGLTINDDPSGSGPTFTNSSAAIDLTFAGAVVINDGTFTDGDSNTLIFNSTFDINGGTISTGSGTVDHDNAVSIDGGTYTLAGSGNFDGQISFDGGTLNASTASSLTSTLADLDTAIVLNTGSFTTPASGTFYITGGLDINGGTFTSNGTIESTGSSNAIFDSASALTVNNFTINKSEGYSLQFGNNSAPTMNVNGLLYLQNGEYKGGTTVGTIYANDDLDWATTFDGGTGNLYLKLSANNFDFPDISGLTDCLNITISASNFGSLEIETTSANAISCFNDFKIVSGAFTNTTSANLTFKETFDMNGGSFNAGTADIIHTGATTLDGGTYSAGNSNTGNVTFNGTLNITGGTFSAAGTNSVISTNTDTRHAIVLNSGTFTPSAKALQLDGGIDINSDMFSMSSGTLEFRGDGNSYLDADVATINLNNLAITKNAVSDILYLGNTASDTTLDIAGDITVYGGTLHTNNKADIEIDGNWIVCPSEEGNSTCQNATDGVAKFTPGNKNVTLTGSAQTIGGPNDTSFYDFTKIVTSEDTLYFEAGESTVITNTLTLQGASESARLLLRSTSTSPTASERTWYIDPQGTRTISYVDVKDSTNTNTTYIDVRSTGSTDSGNNVKWLFDGDEDPPPIPEFSTYLLLLISAVGIGLIVQKREDLVKVLSKIQ
ncbi:hypothetical protein GF354_01315 [Candidatus Peregrinibacteria bacterium]|nr:hypothetical protein [Candidatus Peregrinibacteria bacterium]